MKYFTIILDMPTIVVKSGRTKVTEMKVLTVPQVIKKNILKRNIYLIAIFISIFKISIRVRIAQFQAGNLRPCNGCGGPGVKIFQISPKSIVSALTCIKVT